MTGGTANLKGIVEYAKQPLGVAARVGKVKGLGGMNESVDGPQFAVVAGLMLLDSEQGPVSTPRQKKHDISKNSLVQGVMSVFSKAFGKVK